MLAAGGRSYPGGFHDIERMAFDAAPVVRDRFRAPRRRLAGVSLAVAPRPHTQATGDASDLPRHPRPGRRGFILPPAEASRPGAGSGVAVTRQPGAPFRDAWRGKLADLDRPFDGKAPIMFGIANMSALIADIGVPPQHELAHLGEFHFLRMQVFLSRGRSRRAPGDRE